MELTSEEREALQAIIEPEFEVSEIDQRDAEAIKNQDWAKLYTSYRKRIEDMAVTSDPEVIATMAWSVPLLRAMASGKVPPVIPPRRKRKPAMVMTKDWRGMIGADAKPSTLKITRKILHLLGRAAE